MKSLTPNKTDAAFLTVTHTLNRTNDTQISGLTSGEGYYVVGCGDGSAGAACSTFFQLASSPTGMAINLNNAGRTGGPHVFQREGRDLSSGATGDQTFVLDISAGSGTQQLVGIGGASGGGTSGNQIIEASASGAGGGLINVASASSTASTAVTISTTIHTNAQLTAGTINVTTHAYVSAKSVSSNDGGGLIDIKDASATVSVSATNNITINSNARLTSQGDLFVGAFSDLRPSVAASTNGGGLVTGSGGATTASADYTTKTTTAGILDAAGTLTVEARTAANAFAKAEADVGGLAGSASAKAKIFIGVTSAINQVAVTGGTLTGRAVKLNALVEPLIALASARSRLTAVGGASTAEAFIEVLGWTEVTLEPGTSIIGNVSTAITSEYRHGNVLSNARARCRCLGGDTDAEAKVDFNTDARVVAKRNGATFSTITTSDLTVQANQHFDRYDRDPSASGGFLDDTDEDPTGAATVNRRIFWEARVVMLGEPNPWVEIDAFGNVTKLVNATVRDDNGHVFVDDPFNSIHTVGQLTGATQVSVDNLIYDHGANARILANDPGDLDGLGTPDGEVWGNGGVFEFQQTWDYVKVLNYSNLNLITNIIDVVNTNNPPTIEIRIDTIYDGSHSGSLDPASAGTTFDFDIKYTFPPTLVQIENFCASSCPTRNPFIRLDNYIENPIGTTHIENASGDILSGPGAEIIRTNILELEALNGTIGQQSATHAEPDTTRNPIAAELVRWQDVGGTYHPIVVKVDAGKDAVLDLTANRRTDEALGSAFTIPIHHVNARDDVDIVLNDSKNGNDTADSVLVTIKLYDPATTYYHYVFPTGFSPAIGSDDGPKDPCPLTSLCGSGSGKYRTHFRPDAADPNLERILRAFGTITTEIDSTYDFTDLRAGDDIDVCHVTTGGEEPKTCATTSVNESTHVVSADTTPDKLVHVIARTDVDWSGGAPAGAIDDGVGIELEQIFVRSNGNITLTEAFGDMLVGHVHSTAGDVTLTSPVRILDANRMPTIDVTGVNITMTAGTLGGVGGIGLPEAIGAITSHLGGFLEITVGTGVLRAFDTASNNTLTKGIFLDELVGDMRIHTVETDGDAADLTTGNVSLRTVNGSLVDGKDDGTANVLGQSIDLDANGGEHRLCPATTSRSTRRAARTRRARAPASRSAPTRRSRPRIRPERPERRRRARGDREHLPDRGRRPPPPRLRARRQRRHPDHGPRVESARRRPVPRDERLRQSSPRATRGSRAATTSTRRAPPATGRSSPRAGTSR